MRKTTVVGALFPIRCPRHCGGCQPVVACRGRWEASISIDVRMSREPHPTRIAAHVRAHSGRKAF
jgi:hypothetical protein